LKIKIDSVGIQYQMHRIDDQIMLLKFRRMAYNMLIIMKNTAQRKKFFGRIEENIDCIYSYILFAYRIE